jgi:hypothetical protein
MAAGSIVIDLLMKTGSFETDTARAGKSLKALQKQAEAFGRAIGITFGLSFTGAVAGITALVRSSIDAQDHLNDLSKKTGIAADTLGGIGFAAQQSGLDIDSVSLAAGKLNKSLAEAAAGNVQATEAFKALGINVLDAAGNTKTADVALAEIANKFISFKDGPEKAALALRLFGKAGAEIIPLLDEGGKKLLEQIDFYKKYSGVTAETAQKADAFNDTIVKLKLLSGAFATTLAAELLPTLQTLADAFVDAKEKGDGFSSIAGTIGSIFRGIVIAGAYVIDTFGGVGREIGAIAAQLNALAHLDIKGFTAISDAVTSDGERAKKELDALVQKVLNPTAQTSTGIPGGRTQAPRLPGAGAADTAEAQLQKQLEAQLRAIRLTTDEQQSEIAFSNRFLEGEYQDGITSLQNFFDDQSNIRKHALQVALAEQDKIIAAEQAFAAKTTNPAKRDEADAKVDDARQRKTALIIAAGQAEQLALQQNARDVISLTNAYNDLRSTLASLQGDDFTAEVIKNSQQVASAVKLINQVGGDPAQANELARQLQLRADLNQATKDFGLTLHDLSNEEERVALLQQQGTLTSLGALIKLGEERKKQIPVLEAEVAAYEAIAKASPDDKSLAQKAEDARLQLDKLKAAVDPLAASLNQAFGSDLESALTDFVTGTKSAAEAFHSFTNAVLTDILKLGSKSIAESIIGGSGGLGGLLSGFLGGSGSGGNVQGIGDKYNGSNSGSGLIGGLAQLFAGFFADGGNIGAGQWGVVGERGPEIAYGGSTGKSISPISGTTNHINVMIQAAPGMSRDTAMQQGAAYGQGIQKALARNG